MADRKHNATDATKVTKANPSSRAKVSSATPHPTIIRRPSPIRRIAHPRPTPAHGGRAGRNHPRPFRKGGTQ